MPVVADPRRKARLKNWQVWLLALPWCLLLAVFVFTLFWPVSIWFGQYNIEAGLSWDDMIIAGKHEQGITYRASSPDVDGAVAVWFTWRAGQPWYYIHYFNGGNADNDPSSD